MKQNKQHTQRGAVSLFIVIFAALLMTVVTVGFVQLMIKDQQQATASDLSQSAYDSAQAGVEDAKRLLLLDQSCRAGTAPVTVNCGAIENALTPIAGESYTGCDSLVRAGIVSETNNETIIQQSDTDNASKLDQAYTCVKIGINTDDYKGVVDVNASDMVPLTSAGEFDTVELSWFSRDDVSSATNATIGFPDNGANVTLPPVGDQWKLNYPALMRTQLIQTGSGTTLADFDDSQGGNRSNTNTLFLYPSANGVTNKDFALDARKSPTNAPQIVRCNDSFVNGEYACMATITLPSPINGNTAQRDAYLHLSALYNGAHYSVKLKRGGTYVKFNRAQPEVDSTGRANSMFRRVKARVELKGDFTYPEVSLDLGGNLCKNFTITDEESGYIGTTTCTP